MSNVGVVDAGLVRWLAVAGILMSYAALCGAVALRHLRKRRVARHESTMLGQTPVGGVSWLVLYASQTGTAERIAHQTAQALHAARLGVQLLSLREVSMARLVACRRALLVVSSYGEGDPPDNAAGFLEALDAARPQLSALRYGVLALGDDNYKFFCGFGRAVDHALTAHGAGPLFGRIEANQHDDAAIRAWSHAIGAHASTADLPGWQGADLQTWRFQSRRRLNPRSAGGPVWLVRLVSPTGNMPVWESGDLVQIAPPDASPAVPRRPREYSIASLPADGGLELVVRATSRSDGSPGLVSGWLCDTIEPGGPVALRLREHRLFRLGENAARPMLLIGNGTGIAGLRGHLRARAAAGPSRNWLVFGERSAAHDNLLPDELAAWRQQGVLERLDLVFSRDQAERRYVQHALRWSAVTVVEWVQAGAAIYVCGSLQGMAAGVDQALRAILGDAALDELATAGRYRRDVY